MDVWEIPLSSCSGLDRGFLMDVGPEHVAQITFAASVGWQSGGTPMELHACSVQPISKMACFWQKLK
jgi:hypothetical protein